MWDPIIDSLAKLNTAGQLPDLSVFMSCGDKDTTAGKKDKGASFAA
jgi:hypothetical protein